MSQIRIVSGEVDDDVRKLLEEYNQILERNPLQGYKPHPKQSDFHQAQTRIKAFIGGNRSGKTTASVADDLIQAVDEECLPDHLKPYKKWTPPFHCRIISPDFTSTMEGVIFEKLRQLAPKDQLLGGSWEKAYDKQRRVLRFANGSWFDFLTSEQDLDKFGGVALHRVHCDEEPPGEKGKTIYRECLTRLIDYNGDFVLSMTPLMGLSWVYDEIWEQRHEDWITCVQVDMDENPHLDQEAKEWRLANIPTKQERQAIKEGRFVHFGGLFYDEFSDDEHVVDQPTRDHLKDQNIVVGIDPGFNTTGVVWIAFDNDNSALVFDEYYPNEQVVGPIAQAIKDRNKFWDVEPTYVIDPSARNRATINAEGVEGEFMREGIYTQHGQNDRAAGILEVKARLQQQRLFIANNCAKTIWEIGRYRRDPNSNDEFAAVKVHDHLMDALRYAVMSRAWFYRPSESKKPSAYPPNFEPPFRTVPDQPPMGVLS